MTLQAYLSFLLAALVVIAAPGPDSLNSLAIGLARGRREGVAYALGVGVGCLLHTLWAALGISALVAASATAFAVIKWVGVAYLLWLGVQALRGGASLALPNAAPQARAVPASQRFRQGLLTNALNPKVMLFFLAFLPQFVDAAAPLVPQLVLLGSVCVLLNTLVDVVAVFTAERLLASQAVRSSRARLLTRISGATMIGLGAFLALAKRQN